MTINYVIRLYDLKEGSGVVNKLKAQYDHSLALASEFIFIFFVPFGTDCNIWATLQNVHIIEVSNIRNNSVIFRELKLLISTILNPVDCIYYFRSVFYSKEFFEFCSDNSVVVEHNTKEIAENKTALNSALWNLEWKKLPYYVKLTRSINKWNKKILGKLRGGIVMTKEIGEYQRKFLQDYNYTVIPNGSNFQASLPLEKNVGSEFNAIMLCGSTNHWNGIERLLNSISTYPNVNINFHIIGSIQDTEKTRISKFDNVVFHGRLDKKQIGTLMQEMHIGIGTLELYKKQMEEACPLKVREYFGYGLPSLIAYIDPDLEDNVDLKPYFYRITNSASLIDLQKLELWLATIYKNKNVNEVIYKTAKKHLDIAVKMTKIEKAILEMSA